MPNQVDREGCVTAVRHLGGISFIVLQNALHVYRIVCESFECSLVAFNCMKRIRKGDYVSFSVILQNDEFHAVELLKHLRCRNCCRQSKLSSLLVPYGLMHAELRVILESLNYLETRLPTIHLGHRNGEIFPLDFFGIDARLSSSNALHLDACAMRFCRAFSIQHCFRAEHSKTRKHLAEFDMLEVASLETNLDELMTELEMLVKSLVKRIALTEHSGILSNDVLSQTSRPFRRILYNDVAQDRGIGGRGLGRHEREIAKEGPIFVYGFPKTVASWTAERLEDGSTLSFNLLLPEVGEVAEGSIRSHNVMELHRKFSKLKLMNQLGWYLNSIPYSNCRTGGFGIGLERFAMWLFNRSNIRDFATFYRDTSFSELKNLK